MIDKKLVVISGVAGMTGSKTAEQLLGKGYHVIGFDNFFCGSRKLVTDLKPEPRFEFFEYDINDETQMNMLFSYVDRDYSHMEKSYINCAAVVHTKYFYEPDSTYETNVVAMKKSLDSCVNHGFKKYINCSTSEVYSMASWCDGGVRESSPILLATAEQSLRTSYATGKLLTEFFMKDAVDKGRIVGCSLRFANVYGSEEVFYDHIIPHIIASLMVTGKVKLLENSKMTRRTFLNNADSCSAVIAVLEHESALDGTVYNVGTTDEIYIVDLVHKIASMLEMKADIEFEGIRTCDPARRLLNVDKIQKITSWKAMVTLDEGLSECIQHFKARRGNGK